jgi:shikimate kinase
MRFNLYLFTILNLTSAYKNIIFIGMPNAGKSFLGKKLAEKIDIKYYDCDELNPLFKKYKNSRKDWNKFRDYEYHILKNLLSEKQDKIISTGGGCIENHKIYNLFLNLAEEDYLIHIIRNNSVENYEKNLPNNWEHLWIKRAKWYFMISHDNYWNDGSVENFFSWFFKKINSSKNNKIL